MADLPAADILTAQCNALTVFGKEYELVVEPEYE